MKKTILLLFTAVIMSNAACAQKISADKVPAAVTSAFKTKFPTATKPIWEMENKIEFEVNFKRNDEDVSANFDNKGKWLETETKIGVSALPPAIQSTLKKEFAGFKLNEASKIERIKNGNYYEAEIEKDEEAFDVLLSAEGRVVTKTKLKEKEKKD